MKQSSILLALITSILTGCASTAPKVGEIPVTTYDSMDKFMLELADRAGKKIGSADDFKFVVTQAIYPIGTLMRTGSTIPIDYTACLPTAAAAATSTVPSLFPAYSISNALALDFGLDNEAIKRLVDFGITVKDTDTINLSVKGSKLQTLSDTDLTTVLNRQDCKSVIPQGSAWLVRGYIIGQRTFTLKNEKANNVKGKIEKIASFNISPGTGNASLDLTDSTELGFLQIVSQVAIATTPAAVTSVTKPQVSGTVGKVYVQRDRNDSSAKAEAVVASLKAISLGVASGVEAIDSSRMPTVSQVRYFNEADKALAEKALVELQKQFPNAKLTRVGLPAPSGQLEVWLPRVAS